MKIRFSHFATSLGYVFLFAEQKKIERILVLIDSSGLDLKKYEINVRELEAFEGCYFPHKNFVVAVLVPKIELKLQAFLNLMYKDKGEANIFDKKEEAIAYLKKNSWEGFFIPTTEIDELENLFLQPNGILLVLEKIHAENPDNYEVLGYLSRHNDVIRMFEEGVLDLDKFEQHKAQIRNIILKNLKKWANLEK
jgi:hypothetical protein